MVHQRSAHRSADGCDDLDRKVQAADQLVQETVLLLCWSCPPGSLGAAAHDALMELRPGVRVALAALEEIERLRSLTDEELARRHAFTMLLCTGGRPALPQMIGRDSA
jgi:hypothetical protein